MYTFTFTVDCSKELAEIILKLFTNVLKALGVAFSGAYFENTEEQE